jgi:uncharacterized membrane protein YccC
VYVNMQINTPPVENMPLDAPPVENMPLAAAPVENMPLAAAPVENRRQEILRKQKERLNNRHKTIATRKALTFLYKNPKFDHPNARTTLRALPQIAAGYRTRKNRMHCRQTKKNKLRKHKNTNKHKRVHHKNKKSIRQTKCHRKQNRKHRN